MISRKASESVGVVVAIGLSSLFADAISMAVGDYLSSKAELEFIESERKREAWEVEVNLEGEK